MRAGGPLQGGLNLLSGGRDLTLPSRDTPPKISFRVCYVISDSRQHQHTTHTQTNTFMLRAFVCHFCQIFKDVVPRSRAVVWQDERCRVKTIDVMPGLAVLCQDDGVV